MLKHNEKIFIVIPVYNRKSLTRDCLLSLQKQTFQNIQTIVIDDGSSDGTSQMIQREFPEVVLLNGDGNLWWAGAINLGVEYVLSHEKNNGYILTLNNDTVFYPDYLEILHSNASKRPKSLIGSISICDDGQSTIIDAGVRINWLNAKYTNLGYGKSYNSLLKSSSIIQTVDLLSGRGTIIPLKTFRDIGLYDVNRLPHYGADYEFSHRAKVKGYNLMINYNALVITGAKTRGKNDKLNILKLSELIKSFYSMNSANNLKFRWNFARLCCPGWKSLLFYTFDITRVVIGSFLNQVRLKK